MAATIFVEVENQAYDGLPVQVPSGVSSPAPSAAPLTQGGTFSPLTPSVANVTDNNVVTQAPPQYRSTINVNV